jgi:hypothetical protein
LFETLDLRCTARLPLLIGFWLGNAAALELGKVVKNGAELRAGRLLVTTEITDALIQALVGLRTQEGSKGMQQRSYSEH